MTGPGESSSGGDGDEDLNEVLEPTSEIRPAVEQESESDSVVDDDEADRELPESELNEVVEPASSIRPAIERQAAGLTVDERDDEDRSGGCENE